jgi:uncharacterized protein (TIGR00290 family)
MSDQPHQVLMGWSGGKDSALALAALQNTSGVQVAGLLTTLTEGYKRISMHGVREELLDAQADALGLPLHKVFIPQQCTNEMYQERMEAAMREFQAQGVNVTAFGDLFLEDVRTYRENNLAQIGMRAMFPLWGMNTSSLAAEFIEHKFRAILVCVDPRVLDSSFAGREYNMGLLLDLPQTVDPCGENGEFHTFVYDGPNFKHSVRCATGDVVTRDGFTFCDLVPI